MPAGFDETVYLRINKDVAMVEGIDAAIHYRDYGRAEMRSILEPNQPLGHPESRMLSGGDREVWQSALETLCEDMTLRDVVLNHPRAGWLLTGFTLAGYLVKNQDVAAAVDDPMAAAFHFLEIGLEEGRQVRSVVWDAAYVADRYGMEFNPVKTTIEMVLRSLLAQGEDPLTLALTEAEHWELSGFCGADLSQIFDHEYYHAIACQAGFRPASFSRCDCIDHFVELGSKTGLPIAVGQALDTDFYSELSGIDIKQHGVTKDAEFSETHESILGRLYSHWLTKGMRQGMPPNLRAWALRHFALDVPQDLIMQLEVYRKAARLPDSAPLRVVLDTFLREPRPALTSLDLSSDAVTEFIVDLADNLATSGDLDQAEWLYWHVLSVHSDHTRALRHLADMVQRAGRLEIAITLRNRLPSDADLGWSTLLLVEALLATQRMEGAAQELINMPTKSLADVKIANKHRELAQKVFYAIWHGLADHVSAYGIERTQNKLRLALQACTPKFSTTQRSRNIRHVALVGNEDLYQCKLYRIDQKADQLRAAGYEVSVISPNHGLDKFCQQLDDFDAAIFFRVPAFPPMIEAIIAAAQSGMLTFYEIDDVVFDTEHFPPPLETYAGQIDEAHYASMACGVPLFQHAMSLCDYGIASTATIAKLMEPHVRTGRVFEHHNALGKLHMTAIRENAATQKPTDAPLVIFYGSGTKAHKEDFHVILEPALAEMVKRHPGKIEIRLIGHFGTFTHLDPVNDPVTFVEPIWDFEEFCSRVAQVDINLSVLSSTLLTDAKSEIKWMEAAMFGIPSVVSATATHRETIEHGKTGFLCNTTEDFITALDQLVVDGDLRARIGRTAQTTVMDRYALEPMGGSLKDMFLELRPEGPKKPRLMVVNVFYPPQAIGGATRVVHDNINTLQKKYGERYEIDVICTLEGGQNHFDVTTYAEGGVRVHAITAPPLDGGDMAPINAKMGQVFDDLVDRLKPDLVHFHCIQRLTAAAVNAVRHREIPYVITLHDGWWISSNQFIIDSKGKEDFYDYRARLDADFPERARALVRPLTGATHLLAVSDSFADLHRAVGLENVLTVENGVSALSAPPARTSASTSKVRLAHIGGASRHKGIHLVRNALLANSYNNLEFLLIDHAMPKGSVRYETWGTTQVEIKGKVPQSEVINLYAEIDVLLAPSIWPESYGLVTREAMSCGVWVVASDRGAIGVDIVEDQTGFCIDVGTYAGLADCLHRIDQAPERYRDAPIQSQVLRSAEQQVDELVKIYDEILKF